MTAEIDALTGAGMHPPPAARRETPRHRVAGAPAASRRRHPEQVAARSENGRQIPASRAQAYFAPPEGHPR
jgi:hypothetical protein